MKLVTYQKGRARPRAGALIDGDRRIIDLQAAHRVRYGRSSPMLASVLAMAESGDDALELAGRLIKGAARTKSAVLARDAVRLLAPIPAPPQMRDFLCFEKHLLQAFGAARKVRAAGTPDPAAAIREMEAKGILTVPEVWYERPIFYHPNRLNVVGTGTDIEWPAYSAMLDFELEFGCFIGKPGRDIPAARARSHIFGYTIFNDVSARDEQMKEMPGQLGPGKGKDFDTGNVLGPCLVTADEIGNPYRLRMEARVNGERWGGGNSGEMHWKFEDCIAHASRSETVVSGEFFGSGTVGSGCGVEQMRFLKPGDVVELEVEGIGVLSNRFVKRGA
ncbi:MAG: fumarylacetoacetate hydrolase family protein [Burkholderiales bacterium]|nr:fumarylacetoacetate hydrolase family protein [Burkholderiales bacterium]